MLSYAERLALKELWPDWDEVSAPPQFDWYGALVLTDLLHTNIWDLEDLPRTPEMNTIIKGWAILRSQAEALARQFYEAAREMRNTPTA